LGTGEILTKDLFFSGHTATLFLLFLIMEKRVIKIIFIASTILVGIAVMLQHVHYVVDVAVAPFFAYTSYKIIDGLKNKLYSRSI
jgi:membrane-associated phospholipid phosphatase